LFSTSHDGSLAAQARITTIRVVCNNTLTAALNGNGQMLRVKHTRQAAERLEAARKLMSKAVRGVRDLEEKFKLLAVRKMTRESYTAIMDRLFPKPKDAEQDAPDSWRRKNTLESIAHLFADNDGNAFPEIKGTAYSLVNSVTNYVDHGRMTRITDTRPAGFTAAQARAESALFGSGATLKENALEIILEETEKNPTRALRPIMATVPDLELSPLLSDVLNNTKIPAEIQ
jgi:phage/plasmid-like protein (TIGR03299 family)